MRPHRIRCRLRAGGAMTHPHPRSRGRTRATSSRRGGGRAPARQRGRRHREPRGPAADSHPCPERRPPRQPPACRPYRPRRAEVVTRRRSHRRRPVAGRSPLRAPQSLTHHGQGCARGSRPRAALWRGTRALLRLPQTRAHPPQAAAALAPVTAWSPHWQVPGPAAPWLQVSPKTMAAAAVHHPRRSRWHGATSGAWVAHT
jgi:hypothetical protein